MSTCKLYAVGEEKQIQKLIMGLCAMRDSMFQLTFDHIIPTPKDDKGDLIEDWYDWRLVNWGGTKSEPHIISNELYAGFEAGTLNMIKRYQDFHKKTPLEIGNAIENLSEHGMVAWDCTYELTWGIPDKIFEKIINDYKDDMFIIKLTYKDDECAGFGKLLALEGEVTQTEYYADTDDAGRINYVSELLLEEYKSVNDLIEDIEINLAMKLVGDKLKKVEGVEDKEEFNRRLLEKIKTTLLKYNDKNDYQAMAKLYTEIMYMDKEDK